MHEFVLFEAVGNYSDWHWDLENTCARCPQKIMSSEVFLAFLYAVGHCADSRGHCSTNKVYFESRIIAAFLDLLITQNGHIV